MSSMPADRNKSLGNEYMDYKVGSNVRWTAGIVTEMGKVRFIGHLKGKYGVYIGLEFEKPNGTGDGMWAGERLFTARKDSVSFFVISNEALKPLRKPLDIKLNNSDEKYTAGDVVSGSIILDNEAPIEVTNLKITMSMEFMIALIGNTTKNPRISNRTQKLMTENLNANVFNGNKSRSKVFAIGSHEIRFSFPVLPTDYPFTLKLVDVSKRYFLTAEVTLKSGKVMEKSKGFEVKNLPLNNNPLAHGWQIKSDSKLQKLLKKLSMQVAVPTAIGHKEKVPIHVAFKMDSSKNPKITFRSRCIKTHSLLLESTVGDKVETKNDTVEEVNVSNGEFVHFLQVDIGWTIVCPVESVTYKIEVEAETSNGTLLKLEFPVLSGQWLKDPVRVRAPFGNSDFFVPVRVPNVPAQPAQPTHFIQVSAPAPPKMTQLPFPTSAHNIPSAPPMDYAPPVYDEDEKTPPIYPPLAPAGSAKALFSYTARNAKELSFSTGNIIRNVHDSGVDGWLIGTFNGKTGSFRENYVEMNEEFHNLKM